LSKNNISFLLLLFVFSGWQSAAQEVTVIAHNKDDIIESNDLEEVTSIFGEFKDLEIFEKRLKDANNKLNHH
jgi:hypothetical protein